MYILYRSVGGENPKSRPPYYSKLLCLKSLLRAASRLPHRPHLTFVNDGPIPADRLSVMEKWGEVISLPGVGNSPSYREVLKLALRLPPDAVVYLAEDDYLYTEHALDKLRGALTELPHADYVSLFDHLDRYTRSDDVRGGRSRIYVAAGHHWRTVDSTCLTFGARVGRLKRDAWIHQLCTLPRTPRDRVIWRLTQGRGLFALKFPKRTLIGPVPSLATHMDPHGLAPNIDWQRVAREVNDFEA